MENLKIATFAGGCFWCTEAVFNEIEGVHKVVSGYTGGHIKNPAYREICSGRTGHAEGVQIYYDETLVSFSDLLEIFFTTHDPTTLNRQGNDVGTQYRSAVFYTDELQKRFTQSFIEQLDASDAFSSPIVTEVVPLGVFYEAEQYHQNYYDTHKDQAYCQVIINPKLRKLAAKFSDKLKKQAV